MDGSSKYTQEQQQLVFQLFDAIKSKNEPLALALMEKGVPLDRKDSWHRTPLHVACEPGLEKVALALIEKGVPLGRKDSWHRTPLHVACESGLEKLALALIKKGVPLNEKDRNQKTPLEYAGNANDMYRAFARHLLWPAFASEAGQAVSIDTIGHNLYLCSSRVHRQALHPLPDILSQNPSQFSDADRAELLRSIRLSRTWHHAAVRFPKELLPYKAEKRWKPLIAEPFQAPNQCEVVALTSSSELEEESRLLSHCVGESDYDRQCCDPSPERSHILSVRDRHGDAISTIEVKVRDGELHVMQHRAAKNKPPSNEAVQAWKAFKKAVEAGEVTLAEGSELGEIPNPNPPDVPALWQEIGYEPTWENINKAFDEYKMPYRRASLPTEGRRLVYDDIVSDDGYVQAQHHFIDGYVVLDANDVPVRGTFELEEKNLPALEDGQRVVSVRELDAKSWMRATGVMTLVHEQINRETGENAERTQRWEREAKEPVTFRAVPTPRHEITHAMGVHSRALGADAREERRGTYMAAP